MIIYAATNGYLDDVPVEQVRAWEHGFHDFMQAQQPEIGAAIRRSGRLEEDTVAELVAAIKEYKQRFAGDGAVGVRPHREGSVAAERSHLDQPTPANALV